MRTFLVLAALTLIAVAPAAEAGPLSPACQFQSYFGGVVGATAEYTSAQCVEVDGIIFGGGSVIGLVDNTSCFAIGLSC